MLRTAGHKELTTDIATGSIPDRWGGGRPMSTVRNRGTVQSGGVGLTCVSSGESPASVVAQDCYSWKNATEKDFSSSSQEVLSESEQSCIIGLATTLRAGRFGVRIPIEARDFSLHQNVQTSSAAHPASYSLYTGVISCGKAGET